jgi:PIN domain nuclease of toxin-antitoxin system
VSTVLLDTCTLIWWTLDPTRLTPAAATACAQVEQDGGFLSSISVWEIAVKVKKGKLEIGLPAEEFVLRLKRSDVLEIVPVDETLWLASVALNWSHPDPCDRVIVATASRLRVPIVTADTLIRSFYPQTIW